MVQHQYDSDMQRVNLLIEKYREWLMSKPHVIGVGAGYATRGGVRGSDLSIVVLVDSKLPEAQIAPDDRVPAELEGVRVDVQATGGFTAG